MLKRFLKTITGGNSQAEYEYLETARKGKLTIDYLDCTVGRDVDIDTFMIKEISWEGETALTLYLNSKNICIEVVQHMIRKGANTKNITKRGGTPLRSLAYGKVKNGTKEDVIQLLIKHGAEIKSEVIHAYAANCSGSELQCLIDCGAKEYINYRKKDQNDMYGGFAPIHSAVFESCRNWYSSYSGLEVIKTLVKNGADVNLGTASSFNYSPLALLELQTPRNDPYYADEPEKEEKLLKEIGEIKTYLESCGAIERKRY